MIPPWVMVVVPILMAGLCVWWVWWGDNGRGGDSVGIYWEFVCHDCKLRVDVGKIGSSNPRIEPIENVVDWANKSTEDVPDYVRACHTQVKACLAAGHNHDMFSSDIIYGEDGEPGVYYSWGDYADKGSLYMDLRGYSAMDWD